MKAYKYTITILLWVSITTSSFTQTIINDNAITIDGLKGKGEWDNVLPSRHGAFSLFLVEDSEWFYIGVFSSNAASHYTDVYIKDNKKLINLHASMQLGERTLPQDGKWDENVPEWSWGNNDRWKANVVTFLDNAKESDPFAKQVKNYHGQEFRISKRKVDKKSLLMVLIRDFTDASVAVTFPEKAGTKDTASWQPVTLR